ncbi:MAG: hypothetical protein ACE5G0_09695 [Rhodothermales bacterium]
MKKFLPLLVVFFVAFAGTVDSPTPEPITVEGKLVDTKCYGMNHDNHNDEHMVMKDGGMMAMPACGTACANMGIPVGVLEGGEPGGKVYLIIGPAAGFADHIAKEVKFEGEQAYPGGLIPMKFWVKNDGGEWEETALPGTMM